MKNKTLISLLLLFLLACSPSKKVYEAALTWIETEDSVFLEQVQILSGDVPLIHLDSIFGVCAELSEHVNPVCNDSALSFYNHWLETEYNSCYEVKEHVKNRLRYSKHKKIDFIEENASDASHWLVFTKYDRNSRILCARLYMYIVPAAKTVYPFSHSHSAIISYTLLFDQNKEMAKVFVTYGYP